MTENDATSNMQCPIEMTSSRAETVLLSHGEGGRSMRQLIRQRIRSQLPPLTEDHEDDAANVGRIDGSIVITTDSYVVTPLFFPGGDIGSLAVYGAINDLAVSGAEPLWITLSLILEEGLPFDVFDRVLQSISLATKQCHVRVVTGDTKVVPRGAADGLFVNTCGLGRRLAHAPVGPSQLQVGDLLLVSGPIGQHGIAVLAAREQMGFHPIPKSDSAPLHQVTAALQNAIAGDLRAMRDATRGGLSAVLHEWADACGKTMKLDEKAIPVTAEVRGACELLGLDPLYIANEGTFVAAVSPRSIERALATLRQFPLSASAVVVGEVIESVKTPVVIQRLLGRLIAVDEPSGAPLPRIC